MVLGRGERRFGMSRFTRYLTALAMVLAVGVVCVGCPSKPKKKTETPPVQPDRPAEDALTMEADTGDVDIFAGEGDNDSARASSEDVLGTTEEEPEVELPDEEVEAPPVGAPEAGDIQDM
jgi:hypothetical protein